MRSKSTSLSQAPKTILLVDDNAHGLVARRGVLTNLGYQVRTFSNAEEALRSISEDNSSCDVLITDYKMMGMNGVELIREVRQISPATKTVLLSGFVLPLGMTEKSTGADAVLAKNNGEVEQLTRTVRVLLTRKAVKRPPATQRAVSGTVVKPS